MKIVIANVEMTMANIETTSQGLQIIFLNKRFNREMNFYKQILT